MSYFDIALLVIITGFGLFGLWFGLICVITSIVGTVAAVYLATRFYEPMANWLINVTGWGQNFSKVIMFIIAFIIINRLVVLVFWFIKKGLKAFTNLPVIRGLDRLAGFVFGVAEGVLALGIIFYFIARFPVGDTFMGWITTSVVVPYLVGVAGVFLPLVPEAIKILRSTIEGLM